MKKLYIAIGLLISTIGYTQTSIDALRYSKVGFGGTAKYMGTAGAYGAIGGDASCLSVNPGGIGIYKKSELSLSMGFYTGSTESTYLSGFNSDIKYNFNFPNFSLIGTFKLNNNNPWKSIHAAFGMNRLANFHNRIDINGGKDGPTITNVYLTDANNNGLNNFNTLLAYNTYLLDSTGKTDPVYSSNYNNLPMQQRLSKECRGAINETYLSLGGNYSDKFYIGATIGLPSIRYIEETQYMENNNSTPTSDLSGITTTDYLKTTGNGVNAKIGFIYKPIQFIRLGGAIHTPTYYYEMRDEFSSSITTKLDKQRTSESDLGFYNYELTTPFRAIGSLAFVFKKYGYINVDIERVNYTNARFYSKGDPFIDVKDNIKNSYTYTNNYRAGGELTLSPVAFRLGYAYYGSPYKNNLNDGAVSYYTFGFGIKLKKSYVDFAYVISNSKEDYYIHKQVNEAAKNNLTSNQFSITYGVRF